MEKSNVWKMKEKEKEGRGREGKGREGKGGEGSGDSTANKKIKCE